MKLEFDLKPKYLSILALASLPALSSCVQYKDIPAQDSSIDGINRSWRSVDQVLSDSFSNPDNTVTYPELQSIFP